MGIHAQTYSFDTYVLRDGYCVSTDQQDASTHVRLLLLRHPGDAGSQWRALAPAWVETESEKARLAKTKGNNSKKPVSFTE